MHADRHIKTMNRPGLRAGPIEKKGQHKEVVLAAEIPRLDLLRPASVGQGGDEVVCAVGRQDQVAQVGHTLGRGGQQQITGDMSVDYGICQQITGDVSMLEEI